ncbi:MAG: trypsin-like peptidase domain-containing protein [Wenzhouxiangella sp.]|nr:trypsin-like peptidase domain-containing protein [Wenzhouxiangella sp.]MCH8476691.1 trypsin-like peptidase domain-containing protein [Wenzhouxiangella sp.]TVR96004.1 MAG: PDZ domain-containing protein [Wenzhouxiangellaceae bacterium]
MSKILQFALQFVVLGLAMAFITVFLRPDLLPALRQEHPPPPVASYADAVNLAAPSVVSIYTRTMVAQPLATDVFDPLLRALYGDRIVNRPRRGLGSGVIVSSDGLILTTLHVISNVDNIAVALWDGRVFEAHLVGADPATDLAVLRIEVEDDLPAANFAASSQLRAGDVVLAIGNAFGLSHTVTMGIVSATGRGQLNLTALEDFIQTDAAINAGNSGGALVNPAGEVVGINSASLSQSIGAQGISFAIPASLAREIKQQIIAHGEVPRGWMGVDLSDLALAMQFDGTPISGARVARVDHGGPGWRAGLRPGDIVVNAGGQSVSSARELNLFIAQQQPGSLVELNVLRGNQLFATSVTLIQQPPPGR